MNYRHIYHAGSFSDVVKHIILMAVIAEIQKKPKAFTVLDAFAGVSIYDLSSLESMTTQESQTGVKLFDNIDISTSMPENVRNYASLIAKFNLRQQYPGSPTIIREMIGNTDNQLIACELHPDDHSTLKRNFYYKNNVHVHNIDAYSAIKAFLPFKNNRGLVFLDPAFEVNNEFDKLVDALRLISIRAKNICTIIWYPNKYIITVKQFMKEVHELNFKEYMNIKFTMNKSTIGLRSCGVLIINPPNIQKNLNTDLKYLTEQIYSNEATFSIAKFVSN